MTSTIMFDAPEFYPVGFVIVVHPDPDRRVWITSHGERCLERGDLTVRTAEQFRTWFPDGVTPDDGTDGWSWVNNGWWDVTDDIDNPDGGEVYYSLAEALNSFDGGIGQPPPIPQGHQATLTALIDQARQNAAVIAQVAGAIVTANVRDGFPGAATIIASPTDQDLTGSLVLDSVLDADGNVLTDASTMWDDIDHNAPWFDAAVNALMYLDDDNAATWKAAVAGDFHQAKWATVGGTVALTLDRLATLDA